MPAEALEKKVSFGSSALAQKWNWKHLHGAGCEQAVLNATQFGSVITALSLASRPWTRSTTDHVASMTALCTVTKS